VASFYNSSAISKSLRGVPTLASCPIVIINTQKARNQGGHWGLFSPWKFQNNT